MTARRRGKGEGSIYQRASDGRWVAALIMEDGRRMVRRASSRKEAAAKLELLLKARAEGQAMAADRSTSAFFNEWLAVVKHTVAAGTFERYEQYIRVHVIPTLGRIRLARVTPQHLRGSTRASLLRASPPPRSTTCIPSCTAPSPRPSGGVCYRETWRRLFGLRGRPTWMLLLLRSSRPEHSWPRVAIALRPYSYWRSRLVCAVASCSRSAGRTSTSTRACFRSAARFVGPGKGSPSALQSPQHPGAR